MIEMVRLRLGLWSRNMSEPFNAGEAGTTRRRLLRSNIKVIAAVATGALATRLAPAKGAVKCFLKGTKIETVAGERRVEDLVVGDLLLTVFGGTREIQWIVSYRRTRLDP